MITRFIMFLTYSYSVSHYVSRLFETLQSLFWSIFGLLNLYVTNVKARHEFTEYIGATMFGTYNVISLVVLLNMLIAMMNNSYQLIAVSHHECFHVFRIDLMHRNTVLLCQLGSSSFFISLYVKIIFLQGLDD